MNTPIKIVVPIYKTPLSAAEEASVRQSVSILGQYPFTFVIPEGMSHDYLLALVPKAEIIEVTDEWLGRKNGIAGYNRMMMSKSFYEIFSDCEYILICQPDVWVFRDELASWCERGYDYVGAPWIRPKKYDHFLPNLWLHIQKAMHPQRTVHRLDTLNKIGNGGFSLRKVSSHIEACKRYSEMIERFCRYRHHLYNEDVFWAVIPDTFKYPSLEEAMKFSFDVKPHMLYAMNGNQLPFACHGWTKPRLYRFWEKYIPHTIDE